jgi:hypothetical protein
MSNKIYFKDYYNGLQDAKVQMIKSNYEKINDLPEKYSSLDMNLNYDGRINEADVKMDINKNGEKKYYNFKLDKDDLEKIITYPTIEKPLEVRLKDDFFNQYNTSYESNLEQNLKRNIEQNLERSFERNIEEELMKNSEMNHTCHLSPQPCSACQMMTNNHTCHLSPQPCSACQIMKNPKPPLAVVEIDYKEPPRTQITNIPVPIPVPFCPTPANNCATQNHLHYHMIHKLREAQPAQPVQQAQPESSIITVKKRKYTKKIIPSNYLIIDRRSKKVSRKISRKNKKSKKMYTIKIPKSLYYKINKPSTTPKLKSLNNKTIKAPTNRIIMDDFKRTSPNKSVLNKTITQINK